MSIDKETQDKPYIRRPFTCDACGTSFKHKKNVLAHIQVHNENSIMGGEVSYHINQKTPNKKTDNLRPFPCDQCKKSFKQKHHLYEHTLYVHSNARPHSCDDCGLTFKLTRDLRLHEAKAHNRRPVFRCSECGVTCEQKHFLRGHIARVHDKDKTIKVEKCMLSPGHESEKIRIQKKKKKKKKVVPVQTNENVTVQKNEANENVTVQKNETNENVTVQKNETNENVTVQKNETNENVTVQENEEAAIQDDEEVIEIDEVIVIQDDDEMADRNADVIVAPKDEEVAVPNNREALVQSRQRIPFSCMECRSQFRLKLHLREHMTSVHGRKIKRKVSLVSCDGCGESFKQKRTLEKHCVRFQCGLGLSDVKTVKGVSSAKSGIKKLPFSRNGPVQKQKITAASRRTGSNPERPYHCQECNNSFKQAGHLHEHVQYVHSEGLPFVCNVCDKAFKRARSLRLHMVSIHHLSVPYICRECGDTFKSVNHLRMHSRTHIKRPPLPKAIFPSKNPKNPDKPFGCAKCTAAFRLSVSLSKHYMKVHGSGIENNRAVRGDEFENGRAEGSSRKGSFSECDSTRACPCCGEVFDDYLELRTHAANCEPYTESMIQQSMRKGVVFARRQYECHPCQIMFHRARLYDSHMKEVHDSKFFVHLCQDFACVNTHSDCS